MLRIAKPKVSIRILTHLVCLNYQFHSHHISICLVDKRIHPLFSSLLFFFKLVQIFGAPTLTRRSYSSGVKVKQVRMHFPNCA